MSSLVSKMRLGSLQLAAVCCTESQMRHRFISLAHISTKSVSANQEKICPREGVEASNVEARSKQIYDFSKAKAFSSIPGPSSYPEFGTLRPFYDGELSFTGE